MKLYMILIINIFSFTTAYSKSSNKLLGGSDGSRTEEVKGGSDGSRTEEVKGGSDGSRTENI